MREHGGAVYVWPYKAHCCGGMVQLTASTERREDKVFRRVEANGIELYLTVGMKDPESLHLELGRRGRINAYFNGLAWVI